MNKQRYFDAINKYKQQNDLKVRQLSSFMEGDVRATAAKRDELNYMKAIEEKAQKDLQ